MILRLLVAAAVAVAASVGPGTQTRRIAVTIDDLPTISVLGPDIDRAEQVTRDLLAALTRHKVPAIGFVNEGKLNTDGQLDPRRVALLQQWVDAGLELGNHSFSHPDLHTTPIEDFERNVLQGEKVTRALLRKAGKDLTFFRHPFLHTGRDRETQTRFHKFLATHGYRVAPVTIDNGDYIFAAAYERSPEAQRPKVLAEYLAYMEQVVAFYEQQSIAIAGREIAQTLLIHANALNAAAFDDLARMLARRGYTFISLGEALTDPAYQSADEYVGAGGISWLHRWAMTAGKPSAIFLGEPAVPDWIDRASKNHAAR